MHKPHYAWLICLGAALSLCVVMGLGVNIFTIYQPEIIALNGFTNAQGSWITTTRSLFILGTLLVVNQLCARLGLRLVMTLGMLFVGLSCFSFGMSTTFPMYCFSAALTGVGYCMGGMVPLSLIISNWFESRRGLALGLASAGSGVVTIFAPGIISSLIRSSGLKTAFFAEGAFILVLCAVNFLLLRDTPASRGCTSYGAGSAAHSSVSAAPAREGYGKGPILIILLAAFLLGGPVGPAFTHLTVLFTSEGFDPVTVAGMISFMGLSISVGKIICGQLNDRLGGLISNYIILGVYLVGLLLCTLAGTGSLPLAYAAITAFSFGISVTGVSPAVWAKDLAAERDYPATVRAITTAYTLGMLVFGPIPGMMADRFGSYAPSYLLFAAFQLVLTALIQGVYHRLGVGRRP